jgi:hypothetical protein
MHGWQRLRRQRLVFPQPLAREATRRHSPKWQVPARLPPLPSAGQCQPRLTTKQ